MKSPAIAALIAQAEQLQQAARDERKKLQAAYGLTQTK